MTNIIQHVDQLTPQRVTQILRERGILPRGSVTALKPQGAGETTFASIVWRATLDYSSDAPPDAPRHLFLKCTQPSLAQGSYDPKQLVKEVLFYQQAAPRMEADFTIPCYDVCYDAESGASHLLLKDVSETHASHRQPTSMRYCELAVDALAGLHACWWDHPWLGNQLGRLVTKEERRKNLEGTRKTTRGFMEAAGDALLPAWREHYQAVLDVLPNLFRRHESGKNLTLAHGDAHLGNFLFPKDNVDGRAYLLDWQFWHPTIGGTDLAFLMAVEWEPAVRRQFEQPLIERYYQQLLLHGIDTYDWQTCWDDYRLSVILVSLFIPVWRWGVFNWGIDLPALERSMTAFEELNCEELLKEVSITSG
ncbi:MAG: phosphotransferase [Anaerolineaceae bacterium]|nr:phosphotransferase [Anaerolineaceae bacterium]